MRTRALATPYRSVLNAKCATLFLVIAGLLLACGGGSVGTLNTIVVSPASSYIAINGTQTYTATAQDAKGKTISGATFTWASTAPDVASIDNSGVATGHIAGTAQITASASGVISSAAMLNVITSSAPIASITLSPISASIVVGQTQQFTAKATDAGGNAVSGATFTWSNSAAGVALVSTTGLATGVAPGTAVITASIGSVTSPAATLTVTAP